MLDTLFSSKDARQTPQWASYLSQIGWKIEKIDHMYIFIRKLPIFNMSFIKIQHPLAPYHLDQIEKIVRKYRAICTVIEPHPYNYDGKDFQKFGYLFSKLRFAHSATIKIDIQKSKADLFASFSENAKRNIRKAEKNNLRIKTVWLKNEKNDEYFKQFYRLLINLAKIKNFYAPSYEEYYKKMTAFRETSFLIFAYEEDSKDPLAVVWYASFDDVLVYLQTGIIQKGYDLLANYLLVWEGLKIGQKNGMKIFDFETVYDHRYPAENKKWKGYSEFKKRFHGEIIYYPPSWIKWYNPILKIFYKAAFLFSR